MRVDPPRGAREGPEQERTVPARSARRDGREEQEVHARRTWSGWGGEGNRTPDSGPQSGALPLATPQRSGQAIKGARGSNARACCYSRERPVLSRIEHLPAKQGSGSIPPGRRAAGEVAVLRSRAAARLDPRGGGSLLLRSRCGGRSMAIVAARSRKSPVSRDGDRVERASSSAARRGRSAATSAFQLSLSSSRLSAPRQRPAYPNCRVDGGPGPARRQTDGAGRAPNATHIRRSDEDHDAEAHSARTSRARAPRSPLMRRPPVHLSARRRQGRCRHLISSTRGSRVRGRDPACARRGRAQIEHFPHPRAERDATKRSGRQRCRADHLAGATCRGIKVGAHLANASIAKAVERPRRTNQYT